MVLKKAVCAYIYDKSINENTEEPFGLGENDSCTLRGVTSAMAGWGMKERLAERSRQPLPSVRVNAICPPWDILQSADPCRPTARALYS